MAETILIEIVNLFNWEPLKKTSRAQMILEEVGQRKADELLEGFAFYILNLYRSLILNAIRSVSYTHLTLPTKRIV